MTKKQVIDFVKSELECGNCILAAALGSGGAGAYLVCNYDFAKYLETLEYVGQVEPITDIGSSPYYDPSMRTYQFNGANGFFVQIQAL